MPCNRYQQKDYVYQACFGNVNGHIKSLVCEGVAIRGIARVLKIAPGTVLSRIRAIAESIVRPKFQEDCPILEMDELWTYIGRKANDYWLAYALDHSTGQVVDFVVGKRNKGTPKQLIDCLLDLTPKIIRTDKLTLYQRLIPKGIHRCSAYCINRIERKNLSIRTHLKGLSRRTICFSRSITMLESCLRIYFWR